MRELTLIVNVMNGKNGDMLECAKYYSIKKEENGKIVCVFKKRYAEAWSVIMTLTALEPYTRFEVRVGNQIQEYKRANRAGVLETRLIVPENDSLTVYEISNEDKTNS